MKLHGGTPFESGVEVDPAISLSGIAHSCTCVVHVVYTKHKNLGRRLCISVLLAYAASGSRLPPILRKNQTPRLYVQLVNTSRETKSDCRYSTCPHTLYMYVAVQLVCMYTYSCIPNTVNVFCY